MSNIDNYIENPTLTEYSVFFKTSKPFSDLNDNEIILIPEDSFEKLIDNATSGYDFTDEELVRIGFAYSKSSLRKALLEEFIMLSEKEVNNNGLVQLIFDKCTWEDPSSVINSLWNDEKFIDLICE